MTKKRVLISGAIGIAALIFLAYLQNGDVCYSRDWCRGLWGSLNIFGEVALVLIPVFFFSLITYKMQDEVFRSWWGFARWFVPVIVLVTLFQNMQSGGGGLGIGGAVSGAFDFLVLVLLYAIFVIVSIVRIVSGYFRSKRTA